MDNFAAETDKTLLGFEINPLHNLVHLAIGLAGLALWRRLDTVTYGWLLGRPAMAWPSSMGCSRPAPGHQLPVPQRRRQRLHLVSALAGLAIALWPAQRTARRGLADRGA